MSFKSTVSILSLIMALGPLSNAMAQAGDDTIIVKGKYLSIDKINSVKTPTPIIDVPQSLSIITDDQIDAQAFRNIGDIVRYIPGLSISQGEGHRDAIIIRGQQTTADFFIDGIRDDVQYYRPLYNVEQVEILRGSNALLFGRGGAGGIINRVSKKAEIGERFTVLNAGLDTFGAYSVSADSNFAAADNAAFRVNAYYQNLDNHRDHYGGESYAINPTLTFEMSPQTRAVWSYEYVNDDRVVDRGVPSVPVANGPDRPLKGFDSTFFGSVDQNFTTLEAHILSGRIDHEFSHQLRANLTLQYADYDKLYQNIYPAGLSGVPGALKLDGYQDTTRRENLILQGNLIGEFMTGSIGHTLLVGAEFGQQDTANARNDNLFVESQDDQITIAFTDPFEMPAFSFATSARNRTSDVKFMSFYLQDQIDLTEQFKLIAGARFDSFDIDVDDINNAVQFSRKDEEVTPRLGAIYKPAAHISIYASYSETFLPRSGDQFLTLSLDTSNTDPQFYKNQEIGVKWDLKSDLSLTAALFDLERESFTTVDPNDAGRLITVDGSNTTGFEVQLTGNLTQNWSIATGYSHLEGVVKDLSASGTTVATGRMDGNKTRQTPEHMFSIWNNVTVTEKLSFGVGVTYQDDFFVREDNTVQVPSFTRVDASIAYELSDRTRVQFNVENLFDREYFPDAHSNDNISTGKPFNMRFSITTTF